MTLSLVARFYICHMIHRVSVAWSGEHPIFQLMTHGVLVGPVVLMVFFALPITTRNISLLYGVLHLQQDAVSEVLDHMEVTPAPGGGVIFLRGSLFSSGALSIKQRGLPENDALLDG